MVGQVFGTPFTKLLNDLTMRPAFIPQDYHITWRIARLRTNGVQGLCRRGHSRHPTGSCRHNVTNECANSQTTHAWQRRSPLAITKWKRLACEVHISLPQTRGSEVSCPHTHYDMVGEPHRREVMVRKDQRMKFSGTSGKASV